MQKERYFDEIILEIFNRKTLHEKNKFEMRIAYFEVMLVYYFYIIIVCIPPVIIVCISL